MNQFYYHFLEFSDYRDFDAKIKLVEFFVECSSTNLFISIETWMVEIKPVDTEKHEFEYRVESRLIAAIGSFGLL